MSTNVVIATRSGVVSAPDGTKHRLVRGRTLADARHPVAAQFPELFAPHTIDLPYEGDEPAAAGVELPEWADSLDDLVGIANDMREQLARIRDGLAERNVIDLDNLPTHVGWLGDAIFEALDADLDPVAPPPTPRRGPGRPRKQTGAAARAEE